MLCQGPGKTPRLFQILCIGASRETSEYTGSGMKALSPGKKSAYHLCFLLSQQAGHIVQHPARSAARGCIYEGKAILKGRECAQKVLHGRRGLAGKTGSSHAEKIPLCSPVGICLFERYDLSPVA